MACASAQNLHAQLVQSKAKQARLEVQHQEHIAQYGRLQRAVHGMEAVALRTEQNFLRLKQDNCALARKVHGVKLSLKAQLTAKTAHCANLQSMLDDALSSNDLSQSAFSREASLLRYQLKKIWFDFESVLCDLNDAFESSLHREAHLNSQMDEYKTQQKVLSVMMERIWLVVAAQAEGTQAWRYLETAMATEQVPLKRIVAPAIDARACRTLMAPVYTGLSGWRRASRKGRRDLQSHHPDARSPCSL